MPLISQNIRPLTEDIRDIIKEELGTNKINNPGKISEQVFVSHSFKEDDPKLAEILKNELSKYDIISYLAEKEKKYGYIISNKIRDAIQNSFCVVVILTKNSIISASVNQELGYAMGIGRDIIPMVHSNVKDKVGVLLNDIEGEEFNNDNFEEKCRIISEHISKYPRINEKTTDDDEQKFLEERGDF